MLVRKSMLFRVCIAMPGSPVQIPGSEADAWPLNAW
jgi:hypothetical protein